MANSKKIDKSKEEDWFVSEDTQTCDTCDGDGLLPSGHPCKDCSGHGVRKEEN